VTTARGAPRFPPLAPHSRAPIPRSPRRPPCAVAHGAARPVWTGRLSRGSWTGSGARAGRARRPGSDKPVYVAHSASTI
jgi:hypothetical protein